MAGNREQVTSVAGHTGDSVKTWAPSPALPGSEDESPLKSTAQGGHLSVGGSPLNLE